ncbi:MAG: prepilin-type N-terminal cleavage/methylation domain-containing protein [Phycisphaeraceae bacterium]|nr:prepilin-type N-terminal cleavage/methylation domain-containing protein [Phycisphaeraceae bacterium]
MRLPASADSAPARTRDASAAARSAFTLLEVLIVIVVLGIAGALVIPQMGQTGILKVQAAVRTVVSDITFIQAEAVAFQERRAMVFDVDTSSYALVEVPGSTIDPVTNTMFDPTKPGGRYLVDFRDDKFGDARITSAVFSGTNTLIFDGMGGPVADAAGAVPGNGGVIRMTGSGQAFLIRVEPFTGRVVVSTEQP